MTDEPVRTVRVAVAVPVEASEVELVADALFVAGASAVLERTGDDGGIELVADLDPSTLASLGRPMRALDDSTNGEVPTVAAVPEPIETRRCGRRLVVHAVGRLDQPFPVERTTIGSSPAGDLDIVVEAGRAFGTGSHLSTRLCLAALEPLAPAATAVLDVGCGTGVLGVAAALLGAGEVRAIDVESDAVLACGRAARRNGVEDRMEVDSTPLDQVEGRFDLVLANLLIPIIEALGDDVARVVAPGGSIIVGGLLLSQRARALEALSPLVLEQQYIDGDWVAMQLTSS